MDNALRYALDNSEVKSVTSIGCKKISHPKLKEVLHQNFADCFLGEPRNSESL
jgi:hypothetical protein